MTDILLSIVAVLIIIYVIPILVYGIFSAVAGLEIPKETSPAKFLLSIFISKTGTAIAFVLIFYFALSAFGDRWLLYAFLWWVMFVLGEIGQAIGPNYTWKEAIAGIISETIYLPLSAYLLTLLIK